MPFLVIFFRLQVTTPFLFKLIPAVVHLGVLLRWFSPELPTEVTTPFLFKLIPAVVHLGVLLRWFSPELPTEVLFKGELMRSDTAKRISLMVDVSHDL
nr:K(+) efflux antiporter 4 [Tanacetum cinerariifolium]